MRKSYIGNSAEALNLHNGTQTAIVVKMKVQPTPPRAIYEQNDCKVIISDSAVLQGGLYASRVLWNCNKHPQIRDCTVWRNNLPYQIGQEVYVRETIVCNALGGAIYKAGGKVYAGKELSENEYIHIDDLDKSDRGFIPLCKEKHARTRFNILRCEVVRVKEITEEQAELLCLELYKNLDGTFGGHAAPTTHKAQFYIYCISKFGQSAWDNNNYIWYYTIEKI